MVESFRDGNVHLQPEAQDLFQRLRDVTGTSNVPIIVARSDQHGAATDMKKINLGQNYVSWTLEQNYHGFPSDLIAAGVAFTLAHEIGHITVHPGRVTNWWDEVDALPVDAHEQGDWSNVISDIMVNYNVSRGNNFINQTSELAVALRQTLEYGHYSKSFFRIAGTPGVYPYGDPENRTIMSRFPQTGVNSFGQPVEDNRYTPPESTGLVQGDFNPGEEDNPNVATKDTPLFQQLMGYGRGPQVYPPVMYCVLNNNPDTGEAFPENWRTARLKKNVSIHYCSDCNSYQDYQSSRGKCEVCGKNTTSQGSVSTGDYVVTEVMTFDGRTNPEYFEPIMTYMVNGIRVPARLFAELCPDTGKPCDMNWNYHFGYFPEDLPAASQRRKFQCRFLLLMEWAATYSNRPSGYAGKKGKNAAYQFMKDMAYTLHTATIEGGGVGA
tara:strand:+ start:7745 stop:9058 length:1314 start_codon:yes stop_codon:yes gene_type:complete